MCNPVKTFDREDAYKTLDTINMWIENCDNKVSIILGSIGVVASILLSSDFAKVIKKIIENAFVNIGIGKIVYVVIFTTGLVAIGVGLGYLISCITPKIVLSKKMSEKIQKSFLKRNTPITPTTQQITPTTQQTTPTTQVTPNEQKSIMFYGIVATIPYEQYYQSVKSVCKDFDCVVEDLVFQIHSASVICNSKFKKLQKGLIFFLIGLIICLIQVVVGYYAFLK